jgi:hypothetical protein
MFGKTRDVIDAQFEDTNGDGFFGDEEAADHGAQIESLRDRVKRVEGQINSQFTSMAAYAQIAQEQIELARAESMSASERTESRLTQLIERERGDRLESTTSTNQLPGPTALPADVDARLTALEEAVETIKLGISDCLSRQKDLADAITSLFAPPPSEPFATLPPPVSDGPIGGLAMHG